LPPPHAVPTWHVATVYLYGRDETATPELAIWFARKMSERMRPPEPEPVEGDG